VSECHGVKRYTMAQLTVSRPYAEYFAYDHPKSDPAGSRHWQSLPGSDSSALFRTRDELLSSFAADVASLESLAAADGGDRGYTIVLKWSAITGYIETVTTNKDPSKRFRPFPLPAGSLDRLVVEEFMPLLDGAGRIPQPAEGDDADGPHRDAVRSIANALWGRARNRTSENHSKSVYSLLRGEVESPKMGIDCFSSTLLAVCGMNVLGRRSFLTLSEIHAYESHRPGGAGGERKTCEVSYVGADAAAKRGMSISEIREFKATDTDDSWMYMNGCPVICETAGEALAALVSATNFDIDKNKDVYSEALIEIKRDMLWVLFDAGFLKRIPYALSELADCEGHMCTERGTELVEAPEYLSRTDVKVSMVEKLHWDSISVSRKEYRDGQMVPYCYAGHHALDLGRLGPEHHLVEAMRLYHEAARVVAGYSYDVKDEGKYLVDQLKVLMDNVKTDILMEQEESGGDKKRSRRWSRRDCSVATATWHLGFLDSILSWEERAQRDIFGTTKMEWAKLLKHFDLDVRKEAFDKVHSPSEARAGAPLVVLEDDLLYFRSTRSKRLAQGSSLSSALLRQKVTVGEGDVALPPMDGEVGSRSKKRARTRR